METNIALEIMRIEERMEKACLRSGRKREEIKLMAVSKFHSIEKAEEARKCGIRLFGESRVQEGIRKFGGWKDICEDRLNEKTEIHFIGPLQRNKAKAAASFFDCIQSIDRISLIDELGGLTKSREKPLLILLEYHTGEESKAGLKGLDELCRGAERSLSFPGLKPAGLMTIAPLTYDVQLIRSSFRSLVHARDELEKRFSDASWSCLSMGMSDDFETAIEEGSTLVRIGSSIFGASRA